MSFDTWSAVDSFISTHLSPDDEALTNALTRAKEGGLPDINVTPNQGKLLMLLAQSIGAKRILEIGTLGGYSSIWLGRALPLDGEIISIELEPDRAVLASESIAQAKLLCIHSVLAGPALSVLPTIEGTFDLVFIDADKANNPGYYAWARKLTQPGSLIVIDNVVRDGKVLAEDTDDPDILGIRQVFRDIQADQGVEATAIQMVGAKGYDGFALIRVKA